MNPVAIAMAALGLLSELPAAEAGLETLFNDIAHGEGGSAKLHKILNAAGQIAGVAAKSIAAAGPIVPAAVAPVAKAPAAETAAA